MRKIFPGTVRVLAVALLVVTFGLSSISSTAIEPLKTDYPHWNFQDKAAYQKLKRINNFIEENRFKKIIAVFDWDGTLFCENIPVPELNNELYAGQPAWYLWMAFHASKFSFPVFPMYDTLDEKFKDNVVSFTKYLEGRTNIPSHGFRKFIATSLLLAGMTPENITQGVQRFLGEIEVERYAFLPMLDVLQKIVDSGIEVWIITGSNPNFVAEEIKYIENNLEYSSGLRYNFKLCSSPYNPKTGHIAGNGLKLLKNGTFSNVYDNRYVENSDGKLRIVDEVGKLVVVKNLMKKTGAKVRFAAGNSGGDVHMISYVAKQPDSLCIAVEPRGDLKQLLPEHPDNIIEITSDEVQSE
ncbi:MAG: haloacid dehalogenase-like hydrolase [Lentisphaerae bacterium]|nr:haloacid dehalogenase-like hydrolase [Lentisphaerota bacterium]MCP4100048.1 haloacid dehalogenase-like hydrolase [Lentisphaerota bacterium]